MSMDIDEADCALFALLRQAAHVPVTTLTDKQGLRVGRSPVRRLMAGPPGAPGVAALGAALGVALGVAPGASRGAPLPNVPRMGLQRPFASRRAACRACTSNWRKSPAALSSTPLTYLWPSVPPKLLASSTASLMTTR